MTRPPDISCARCEFRRIGLFNGLEEHLFETLDRGKSVQVFRPGQVLFYENSPSLAIYCIHSGAVKLFKTGERGEQQVIRLLGPGDAPGYRPVMANEPFAASAEALEKTSVCVIPRQLVHELLRQSKNLAAGILGRLARDLRISEEQMLALTQRPVRARIAGLLLELHERSGGGPDSLSKALMPLKRKEMAQMVGTTPETFSRTLQELAQKGILSVTRAEIKLQNLEALQLIAAMGRI